MELQNFAKTQEFGYKTNVKTKKITYDLKIDNNMHLLLNYMNYNSTLIYNKQQKIGKYCKTVMKNE